MIITKNFLRSGNTLLTIFKNCKIHSSSIHSLYSSQFKRCRQIGNIQIPVIYHIISRHESSHASLGKDKILNLEDVQTTAKTIASTDNSTYGSDKTADEILPDIQNPENVVDTISDDIPQIIKEAIVPLNELGEPTLQSIGLGSYYTPIGWIQNALEYVHITFGLPWWSSIVVCVVIARILMFPIIIKTQRGSVKMQNLMPQLMKMQQKMTDARVYGNTLEVMQASHDMSKFVKEKKFNPFKTTLLPLVQAPVFISFFFAIRKMCKTPVESFTEGGTLWFLDLTLPDQMYLLPAVTCFTLWVTLEVGSDFGKLNMAGNFGQYVSYAMKVLPIVVFLFTMRFPSGICLYWTATNIFSLIQVSVLKVPAIRKYFGIERIVKHQSAANKGKKNFLKDVKTSFSNMRISRQIAEREKLDQMNFKRAGKVPPAKTFKHNPLLTDPTAAVQTKKK